MLTDVFRLRLVITPSVSGTWEHNVSIYSSDNEHTIVMCGQGLHPDAQLRLGYRNVSVLLLGRFWARVASALLISTCVHSEEVPHSGQCAAAVHT